MPTLTICSYSQAAPRKLNMKMRTLGGVTGDAISNPTGRYDQGVLAQALGL